MRRLAFAFALLFSGCDKKSSNAGAEDAQPPLTLSSSTPSATTTTSSTVATADAAPAEGPITDLVVGTGAEATAGKKVTVHYTLWVVPKDKDGELRRIESSHDKNKPYSFRLGAGGVVKGWDEGIPGMRIGGKRKLIVPPQLGYGPAGSPPSIPGNATLVFEIELLDVKP